MGKKRWAGLTPVELMAGVMMLGFCGLAAGLVGLIFYTYQSSLPPAVADSRPFTPSPMPATPAPTPSPSATLAPSPPLTTTVAATPLPTRVINPETLNHDKIVEITGFTEQWRQLALPEDLPVKFLTRAELRARWQERAFDQSLIDAIEVRREFYVVMGLLDPGVDLVQLALENQTEAILGYYDPREKVMYIVADSVNMFAREEITLAHEYVHALQDHHFDLTRFLNEGESGDTLLATRALPEGDARLLERIFTQQNINQDELDYNSYRRLFQETRPAEGISPALGALTYFPYSAGEYFIYQLFSQGGNAWGLVNQAYHRPPVSSEQVLHPEKYLAGELPVTVELPALQPVLGDAWREIDQETLGEIGLLVWLLDQLDPDSALGAGAGWEGDTAVVWRDEAGRRLLASLSVWETKAEADEFFEAFALYMAFRLDTQLLSPAAADRRWQHAQGVAHLSRRGQQVLILIAPDEALLNQVRAQFADFR